MTTTQGGLSWIERPLQPCAAGGIGVPCHISQNEADLARLCWAVQQQKKHDGGVQAANGSGADVLKELITLSGARVTLGRICFL